MNEKHQIDTNEALDRHLSDIPYDSALIELIKEHNFSKAVIIIAYELGRRKGHE